MRDDGKAVGERLTRLYRKSGLASYGELQRRLEADGVRVTDQTLIHYHNGRTSSGRATRPQTMRLDVMVGLARVYRVNLAEISPTLAERFEREANDVHNVSRLFASYAAGDSNPEPSDSVPEAA